MRHLHLMINLICFSFKLFFVAPVAMDADEHKVLSDDDERDGLITMSPPNGHEQSGDESSVQDHWENRAQSPYSISYRKNLGEPMVTFNSKSFNRTPTVRRKFLSNAFLNIRSQSIILDTYGSV